MDGHMAVGVGFEPTRRLPAYALSRRAGSAAPAPHRRGEFMIEKPSGGVNFAQRHGGLRTEDGSPRPSQKLRPQFCWQRVCHSFEQEAKLGAVVFFPPQAQTLLKSGAFCDHRPGRSAEADGLFQVAERVLRRTSHYGGISLEKVEEACVGGGVQPFDTPPARGDKRAKCLVQVETREQA